MCIFKIKNNACKTSVVFRLLYVIFFADAKHFSQNTAKKTGTFYQHYTHTHISIYYFTQEQPESTSANATSTNTHLAGRTVAVSKPTPKATQVTPPLLFLLTAKPPLFPGVLPRYYRVCDNAGLVSIF